jgi:hypothetical protein
MLMWRKVTFRPTVHPGFRISTRGLKGSVHGGPKSVRKNLLLWMIHAAPYDSDTWVAEENEASHGGGHTRTKWKKLEWAKEK